MLKPFILSPNPHPSFPTTLKLDMAYNWRQNQFSASEIHSQNGYLQP